MEVQHIDPPPPLLVTDAAVRHFRQQIVAAHAAGIRLCVKESGCTGYMYVVDLAEQAADGDLLMKLADDVRLFVDRASLPILRGTTVDFVRDGLNSVLRFGNPNAQEHCGCGESFSISEASA